MYRRICAIVLYQIETLHHLLTFPGLASEGNSFSRHSKYKQRAISYVVLPTMCIVGAFRPSCVCDYLLYNWNPPVLCRTADLS